MIIYTKYLLFPPKLLFSKVIYLKDLSTIYFKHVKMPYIEIFSGYEIWVRTLQLQQQHSLKIVNSKSINLKVLSILYSLQCTKIIRLGTM